MIQQIEFSENVLRDFHTSKLQGLSPDIDRKEVVAHATLSALVHHWPSKSNPGLIKLLEDTGEIKSLEHSRWAIQRRIAIAKLQRFI